MSQSDYIKHKKITTELNVNKNPKTIQNVGVREKRFNVLWSQPAVFDSGDYQDYKKYSLENTTINTKPILNRLTNNGKHVVWEMDKVVVSNCAPFIVCSGTNARPNRIPMMKSYSVPLPQPLTIKNTKNANFQKNACKCIQNRSYSHTNVCKCVTGAYGTTR
jgi:hypothetical protein